MSISGSQPASGIASWYRLSGPYYLGQRSRKWREHPRDAFLTYRHRKWPTRPPCRRVSLPPVLLPPSRGAFFRFIRRWREVKDPPEAPEPPFVKRTLPESLALPSKKGEPYFSGARASETRDAGVAGSGEVNIFLLEPALLCITASRRVLLSLSPPADGFRGGLYPCWLAGLLEI